MQYSVAVRNAQLDAWETAVGTAPLLKLYDGTIPIDCATADTGTVLASGALPSDWMANASGGSKIKNGTYTLTGQAGAGAGTNVTHYRLYDSAGTTCHEQGTVTASGGGGDMTMDNINVAVGQVVTASSFTHNAGNA